MKKIFIIYHGNCKNKGNEALLRGAIYGLKKRFGSVEITCTSNMIEYDSKIIRGINFVNVIPLTGRYYVDVINFLSKTYLTKIFLKTILKSCPNPKLKDYFRIKNRLLEIIKDSDILVGIGGDAISVTYNKNDLKTTLKYVDLAKKYHKRIYFLGQSFDYFPEKEINFVKTHFKQVDLITLRETNSYSYLKQNDFDMDNIKITSDIAIILKPRNTNKTKQINFNYNTCVGINISGGITSFKKSSKKKYIDSMCYLINNLISKKIAVFLIPHVFGGKNNDKEICNLIKNKHFPNKRLVINISDFNVDYSTSELKFIISKMTVFVGARTHSTIAALTSLIPTISISYSRKAIGLNQYFYDKSYKSYIFPIDKLDINLLLKRIFICIKNHDYMRKKLKLKYSKLKLKYFKNFKYLED